VLNKKWRTPDNAYVGISLNNSWRVVSAHRSVQKKSVEALKQAYKIDEKGGGRHQRIEPS